MQLGGSICSYAVNPSLVAQGGLAFSKTLQVPTPYAAADVISRDNAGKMEFLYTIVEAGTGMPNDSKTVLQKEASVLTV